MTNKELVNKALDTAKNHKTIYAKGMFGSIITEHIIAQKSKQYPTWYTSSRQDALRKLIGSNTFGFDCVCFLKGLLWGWNASPTKDYGGAAYQSNGVPDQSESTIINKCSDVSTNFANILPGEMLYMTGHCGIYVGDGLAVECTPSWSNGVQITAVANMGAKAGYNSRRWTKHGKLPYIKYIVDTPAQKQPEKESINVSLLMLRMGAHRGNAQIKTVQRILKMCGYYTLNIDGDFGQGTEFAVKALQKDKGLAVDGIVGKDTWAALLKQV